MKSPKPGYATTTIRDPTIAAAPAPNVPGHRAPNDGITSR
jgi:hypothetical protein